MAQLKRILVVDDDRTTRVLISETLRSEGFQVITASDGRAALRKLKESKFDLALLDVWIPRLNGLEVLKEVCKKKAHPKVIMITSDGTPGTRLAAIRAHAHQCISKPIDPRELVSLVRESLATKPEASPIEVVSARPEWIELVVPCSLEAAARIESFLQQLDTGLPEEIRASVGQAFHELLLNAIEWGGQLDPHRTVRISCLRAKRMLLYRIADPGPGFKIADLDHAAITHGSDATGHNRIRENKGLRPGGFGLVLAQASVDELLYNEAHNEVVFVKYLDG